MAGGAARRELGTLTALALVSACGRIGFGTAGDDTPDGPTGPPGTAYLPLADTYISAISPTSNFGTSPVLELTQETSVLLRFAPMQGGFVRAAWLQVGVIDPSDGTLRVHQVVEGWSEGTQNGNPGVANWSQRDGGQTWAAAGARGAARDAAIEAESTLAELGALVMPLDVAVVNAWRDSPSVNFGLVLELVGSSDAGAIGSREHADQPLQPRLIVDVFVTNP